MRPSRRRPGIPAAFVQILEAGGQSPDHPVHPAIPETRYLKAFFCRVTRASYGRAQTLRRPMLQYPGFNPIAFEIGP